MNELAIVIIGRNEGDRLLDCLQSALNVCANVVYADSASIDGSIQLAQSMGALVVSVDPSIPLNAARGRNAGLDEVRSHFPDCKFVQFIDGDCRLIGDWINVALDFLKSHPRAAVVCGRRFEKYPSASLYNRLADEEWDTPIGLTCACGGDAMMRIDALGEVGGFNPRLMASEEPELTARLRQRGWQIWRLNAPMTEHDARILTFVQWWRRTTRSGYGYAQAWLSTRSLPEAVNQKLLISALAWVVGIPLAVLLIAFASQNVASIVLLPLVYVVQIIRMALRRSSLTVYGLKASSMIMLAKVPELIGAVRVLLRPRRSEMIEYKNIATTRPR